MPRPVVEANYRSQPEEHAFRATKVLGAIPPELAGTFLRNGPGVMAVGQDTLNFFDGHALIAGLTFDGGQATFRSRHVRTPLYERETRDGRIRQRRIFTNKPGRWSNFFALELGNGAMHNVYTWGQGDDLRVIAANDPGHFALDPRTLETRGPESWAGAAARGCDTSPMPYRDPHTGHLIGWVKRRGGARPDAIKFVELDDRCRVARETPFHKLATSPVLVHDQRATARWHVATEQSVRLAAGKAIWGARTLYECFTTPPGATAAILLAPRDGGAMVRVPLPQPWQLAFHVVNAFDDGERVVVDLVAYAGRIRFSAATNAAERQRLGLTDAEGPAPTMMRFVVEPKTAAIAQSRALGDAHGDAPEVADDHMGRPYRYAYLPTIEATDDVSDHGAYVNASGLTKLDVDSGETTRWSAGDAVVSPPAFVARPVAAGASEPAREDDGWLLAWVLREAGASVVVLDAADLGRGPLATIDLGIHLPGVSHVRWSDAVRLAPPPAP